MTPLGKDRGPAQPNVNEAYAKSQVWILRTGLLVLGLLLECPVTVQANSEQEAAQPASPPLDSNRGVQSTRELEQQGPVMPGEPPLHKPRRSPQEKAKERLRRLEEQGARERALERERQTPQERAREQLKQLEQAEKKREQPAIRRAGTESPPKERVRYLLGVYEGQVGIYDEILDRTKVGPGLLHDVLQAPRWLVLGGEHRTRYEGLDGSWRMNEPNGSQLLSMRTRVQVGIQEIFDPLRFLVELQDSRAPVTTTGAHINSDHVNELDIQQLHVDLAGRNFLGTGIPTVLKIGRINMEMGRGRWVGRNWFRNTTNAFDGVHWQLGDERRWQLRSFLVQPVQRFVRTIDPWAPGEENTFWGAYVESRMVPWLETTVHYFGHASDAPGRDFNMIGGRLRKRAAPGEADYELESSYQFGNITAQTRFAHFQHAELGYTFDAPWSPHVLARFDYAGNGFDSLYGRRSFEMHPTGIFSPFQRSNVVSPGARFLITPREHIYVFVQYRAWWLADDQGAWAGAGLQDVAGESGNFVGHTVEVRGRWGLDENLFLQAGYAHLSFGPFAERAPGSPVAHDAHYGYLWTEFMF